MAAKGSKGTLELLVDMARALVRPVVTILFAGAFVYMAIVGTIDPETFVVAASMILAYWFKTRDEGKSRG